MGNPLYKDGKFFEKPKSASEQRRMLALDSKPLGTGEDQAAINILNKKSSTKLQQRTAAQYSKKK